MSYITEIVLKNYRSFVDARCRLSPFTLIVGANNAGKSNLLRAVRDASEGVVRDKGIEYLNGFQHHSGPAGATSSISVFWNDGIKALIEYPHTPDKGEPYDSGFNLYGNQEASRKITSSFLIYAFDPPAIGNAEPGGEKPQLGVNGKGVSHILDKWNSGAKASRERFARVVADLQRCVPEIEALSFYDDNDGKRALQAEQFGLPIPVPLSELSDGTRLVLAILTLVNLETPPPVILLEDINRGLHPRLYEQVVSFLRTIANEGRTQILATTHDPYLIDEFADTPEAVVVVDKSDGASTLSNLDQKLSAFLKPGAELEMPLGELWFSGSLGGVPHMKVPTLIKASA